MFLPTLPALTLPHFPPLWPSVTSTGHPSQPPSSALNPTQLAAPLVLGWGLETTHCLPQFWKFNRPKKNSNSTQFIQGFQSTSNKPLQFVGQLAESKFEGKAEALQVIWQSLSKAVPCKVNGWAFGAELQHSGTAWAGWSGKHKHRVFPC